MASDNFQLSRALTHVQLTDLFDPSATLVDGLLNPESLRYSRQVDVGELSPVNWSHSILMYGSTKSASIPLEFYFSTQLTPRAGGAMAALTYYVDFFDSFCFPNERGAAPPPMLVIWPNVMETVLAITNFEADFARFHSSWLKPAAVRVSVQARELRQSFRTAGDHRRGGMRQIDPLIGGYYGAGSPMNLKRGR